MQGRRLSRRTRVVKSQADASSLMRSGPVRTYSVVLRHLPEDATPLSVSGIVSTFAHPLICQPFGEVGTWRVMFGSRTEARVASASLEGLIVAGAALSAVVEEDLHEDRACMAVVAKGIPSELTTDEAMRVFQRFGHVVGSRASRKQSKPTFRMCVEYTTYDAARNAVTGMNGQVLARDTTPISVKFSSAEPTGASSKKLRKQKSVTDAVLLMGTRDVL